MTVLDQSDGLYIHEATDRWPHGTKVLRLNVGGGDEQVWVAADDFMALQKERDDLRRTLALINAHRLTDWITPAVVALLERAGFTLADAEAMASIIAQFKPLASVEEREG